MFWIGPFAVVVASVGLAFGLLVFWVGRTRKKPGYRRKRPDPNYTGPERRRCNNGKSAGSTTQVDE